MDSKPWKILAENIFASPFLLLLFSSSSWIHPFRVFNHSSRTWSEVHYGLSISISSSYCLDIVWRPLVDGVKVGVCCDTVRVRVILRDSLRCVVRPNGRLEWTWIRILACPRRSSLFTHRCTMEFSPHRHHNPRDRSGEKAVSPYPTA